jgi:hypothetical protein
MQTVLPFKLILNVVLSGVSEFDTSLMTRLSNEDGEGHSDFFRQLFLVQMTSVITLRSTVVPLTFHRQDLAQRRGA